MSDDVGNFLCTTDTAYQVICADEKTADEFASNGFSYSRDYYEFLTRHLAPGGLVAQWVPATLPPRQYRIILKTFTGSFPHVQLWYFLPAHRPGAIQLHPDRIGRTPRHRGRQDHPPVSARRGALQSLRPYGLTSAEALLAHFVADERVVREAVADAPLNTLDHPRYEFCHPWDYAADGLEKLIDNQIFIIRLKRLAYPDFFAAVTSNAENPDRLRRALAAEFSYLETFRQYLAGTSPADLYRMFDDVLAAAPWNDSPRARLYVHYSYFASIQTDPAERERLMRRARAPYDENALPPPDR